MVRNLLVIDVPCLGYVLVAALAQDFRRIACGGFVSLQPPNILMYLLCHCRGQHTGIRSGICDHLLFVQLLSNPQSLVGADLKILGTIILQLRQIV